MSLREDARDLAAEILSDVEDFGWPLHLTSPTGVSRNMEGFSGDIGLDIDPGTGLQITGRKAHISIPMRALEGMGMPRGIMDKNSKPWVVRFDNVMGVSRTYKVLEAMPDEGMGVVTCTLEVYKTKVDS